MTSNTEFRAVAVQGAVMCYEGFRLFATITPVLNDGDTFWRVVPENEDLREALTKEWHSARAATLYAQAVLREEKALGY